MNQSPDALAAVPDPAGSRDEVRRRYLAQLKASARGGPPPDVELLISPFREPQRSELRAELEALGRSYRESEPSAATVDPSPGPATRQTPAAATEAAGTVDNAIDPSGGMEAEAPDGQKKRPAVPETVAGYDIIGVLGRGGMGVVYKARQRGLKRLVALKMILSGDHASEQELVRFRAEAEAVAHLQHPNIVQIYEVGEEQGLPYFSLEFVDGSSLNRKIAGTPLPPREAAALLQQLAEAMHYAHEHGIIHRDLKPANVLLTNDGTPKVGDFGLAKRVADDSGQTKPGTVLGTPSYMAPEQAAGRLAEVGPLSDQYSLGAVLYEMLTGRPPFKGSTTFDTLEQIRTQEPVPPAQFQPNVPRDLDTICLKCLQKDRSKRYASAADLAEDLRRFLAGEPIQARPVGRAERLWRWCKRNPRVAALSAAVALLFLFWALTASALAWGLKLQTDEARKQTINAQESAEQARKEKVTAERNMQNAKDTTNRTIELMLELGANLHSQVDGMLLNPPAAPRQRRQVLALVHKSLLQLREMLEKLGTTKYGASRVYVALGDLYLRLGKGQEAQKMYKQGYDAMEKLAQDEPEDDQTQTNFATTIVRLGDVPREVEGDPRAALERYTKARDVDVAVLKRPGRQREEWRSKFDVSTTDVRMGWALLELGRPAEARKYLDEAREYRQAWREAQPTRWEPSNYLMEVRLWLGVAHARLGDEKAAREQFAEAVRLGEDLMKRHPGATHFKSDMAELQGARGDALLRFGKAAEAAKSYEDSLRNLMVRIRSELPDIRQQPLLALAYERLGAASAALGKRPDAENQFQEALRLRQRLLEIEPGNLVRGAAYVLALARCGQRDAAAAGAVKLLPRAAKKTVLLLDVARCYAVCAAGGGPKKREYSDRAVAALKAVVAEKDYKDSFTLETDPDLAAVRATPAFKALVDDVKGR
jgi:serine/threonine-protein kinase